jgi:simple sugar transport system permease protein
MTVAAIPARRALPRFGRLQTLGLAFGSLGLFLCIYVAPNLKDAKKAFTFEPGLDVYRLRFTPAPLVFAIGLLYVVAAAATFGGARFERAARGLLLTSAVLFVPLFLVLSLALSTTTSTNVISLLVESLKLGVPYGLGAMTGLWCERAGVVNIGIEGMMLTSACVGFTFYAIFGDGSSTTWLWLSIGIAILTGCLLGLLHAVLCVSLRVDQIISGVVINLVALGLTGFMRSEVIIKHGVSSGRGTQPISLWPLSHIPVIGSQVFTNPPIFYLMFVVVFTTWFVLWKTPWGLRVRSVGENPHAAETLGINVIKTRYLAVIIGGLVAGLAGAWFAMESTSGTAGFEENMTNGAGFIALAALIFGNWRPWTAFGGAMLFGFTRALGTRMGILGVKVGDFSIPSPFTQALPYIVTIIVVAGVIGRARPPAADGQPFARSR